MKQFCYCFLSAITSALLLVSITKAAPDDALPSDPNQVGLVAAYSFNENQGLIVHDSSGNGNDGMINGATWTAQGQFGSPALSFVPPNIVTVNDSNSLDLTSGMTLEAWIFPTLDTGTWTTVIFKQAPQFNNQVYGLYGRTPAAFGSGPLIDVYTDTIHELFGPTPLPLNTWTFLSATYDAAGGGQTLYVNGVAVANQAGAGNMITSTGALEIGGNSFFGEFFQGTIDNMRIYNRALTAGEIVADMNSPIGVGPTPTPTPTPSPTPGPCAQNSNYWARNPGAWCVSSMQVGCITYSFSQAVGLIRHDSSHDKTYSVAKNLIAAKLNVACKNTNSTCITAAIAAADAWLCTYPPGSGILANSPTWRLINNTNTALEKYNAGQLCAPSCVVGQ